MYVDVYLLLVLPRTKLFATKFLVQNKIFIISNPRYETHSEKITYRCKSFSVAQEGKFPVSRLYEKSLHIKESTVSTCEMNTQY